MDFKPKLIVFDLDGTLAESKQRVSGEMGILLAQLLEKMPVAVMSGAGFPQFEVQLIPALPDHTKVQSLYLFPDNAAQCYQHKENAWTPVYDNSFTAAEKLQIMTAFTDALVQTHYPTPPQLWGEQLEDRDAEIAFSALGQQAPLEAKEKWHTEHELERDTLRSALTSRLPEFAVSEGGLTTIQVTRKGITKAHGLRELVRLSGITISEILYVGDALQEGGNDNVVMETGVRTQEVLGPEETARLIESILAAHHL